MDANGGEPGRSTNFEGVNPAQKCWNLCDKYPAMTGCSFHNGTSACWYSTGDVLQGNGNKEYLCRIKTVVFGPEAAGYCVDEEMKEPGRSENKENVQSANECFSWCKTQEKAVGCSYHEASQTCWYASGAVTGGNGVPEFKCQIKPVKFGEHK